MYFLRVLVVAISFLTLQQLTAQPASDGSLPQWAVEMYTADADPGVVTTLYDKYYQKNELVKNEHTQYYKRWIKSIVREVEHTKQAKSKNRSGSRMADWSCIGPWDWDHDAAARSYAPGSAHVYTVEQSISDPDVLYAGTATAGLWRTTDRGLNWSPLTYDLDVNQVYAIEIDHTDADVIYASMLSTIMKSTDGGSTWLNTGDAAFQALSLSVFDIHCDPSDATVLLAATRQGLYRTTDGGANWTQVAAGYFLEIEHHPTNSNIIYTVRRDDDGNSSDDYTYFMRSTDGGTSFVQMGNGWPSGSGHQRRTEIAVSPASPNSVYAHATGSVNGGSGLYGIYTSNDMGANWVFACCGPQPGGAPNLSTGNINIMAWAKDGSDDGGQYYYDVAFGVSPTNADSIWAAGVNMWVSGDGGQSFECKAKWSEPQLPEYVHADNHDFHYYSHTGEIWVANDGGIFMSDDNGQSYERRVYGIEGSDFWGFDTGWWEGDIMLGGAYHNGTLLKEDNVYINDWLCTDGGDGNYGRVNPGRPKNVHSWFNIKDLKSDRTLAPSTRGNAREANASYITGQDSDLLYHPNYYDTWWVGSGTGVYITKDNGFSFKLLHDFGVSVAAMDISMADADVLYAATWPGWWNTKLVYRSTDGGRTWTDITPPTSLLINQQWMPYDIVADPIDPMRVTLVRTSMYNEDPIGPNVVESLDGGNTWTDVSGTAMAGESATNMVSHQGVAGGLYIGTRKKVWYKDDSMADFLDISSDLPVSTYSEKLVPWYRKQKLRSATNRSVWERQFPSASTQVIARPAAQVDTIQCTQDSVYFQDLSVVSDDGVSWLWTFEGGTPATSTHRAPAISYHCAGVYDVTLTVTDVNGTNTTTIPDMITVMADCDSYRDPALCLSTSSVDDFTQINGDDVTSPEFTISAWIRPRGQQDQYAGIVMNDSGSTAGLNFQSGNRLAYHWPGGQWWWDSGLTVPVGVWSHVAMVVNSASVTLYLNGEPSVHNISPDPATIGNFKIASYRGWDSRNFYGELEEVCIWDRALTINEIRLGRHLTKDVATDPHLLSYFKFNREQGAVDATGRTTAIMSNGAITIASDAPVGPGYSDIVQVNGAGTYQLTNSNMQLVYEPGVTVRGSVVGSHIVTKPTVVANDSPSLLRGYYILNNYEVTGAMDSPTEIHFQSAGTISTQMESTITPQVYTRSQNEGPSPWQLQPISDYALQAGIHGEVSLLDAGVITDYRQYMLTRAPFAEATANVTVVTDGSTDTGVVGGGSAELAFISSQQGLTLPHFTTADLAALGSPAVGAMVYLTEENAMIYYNGMAWMKTIAKGKLENLTTTASTGGGIGMSSPATSSTAYNMATSGGILQLPNYTNTTITDIATPVQGMMIYNSSATAVQVYDGSHWATCTSMALPAIPVSTDTPTAVEGMAVGKLSKVANAALDIANDNGKTLILPQADYRNVHSPLQGSIIYDASSQQIMLYNGELWGELSLELE